MECSELPQDVCMFSLEIEGEECELNKCDSITETVLDAGSCATNTRQNGFVPMIKNTPASKTQNFHYFVSEASENLHRVLSRLWEKIPNRKLVNIVKGYFRLCWEFLTIDANRSLYLVICILGLLSLYYNLQFQRNMQNMMVKDISGNLGKDDLKSKPEKFKRNDRLLQTNVKINFPGSQHVQIDQNKIDQYYQSDERTTAIPQTEEVYLGEHKTLPLHSLAKWFLETCEQITLPVFLVEPSLLRLLAHGGPAPASSPKLITFGIFAHNVPHLDEARFLDRLEQEGNIVHLHLLGELPAFNDTSTTGDVTLHHILHDNQNIVHIAVFWTMRKFLFTGSLPLSKIQNGKFFSATLDIFSFGHQSRAFDIFQLKRKWTEGILYHVPSDVDDFLWQIPASNFIPCDYERAKSFFSKFRTQKRGDHSRNSKTMKTLESMLTVKEMFKKVKKRLWLAAGSLLGWFRECGIIYYTNDADFGAWTQEYEPADLEVYRKAKDGMTLKYKIGKAEDGLELKFAGGGKAVDVFYFYRENNHTWIGSMGKEPRSKIRERFPLFEKLCSTEVYGHRFNIPCHPSQLILAEYGGDWLIPQRTWIWYESPENVENVGKWSRQEIVEIYEEF